MIIWFINFVSFTEDFFHNWQSCAVCSKYFVLLIKVLFGTEAMFFFVFICKHAVVELGGLWWLAVWLSGNALASINVVALRQTRLVLVLGWVTVCGRVNHFGM